MCRLAHRSLVRTDAPISRSNFVTMRNQTPPLAGPRLRLSLRSEQVDLEGERGIGRYRRSKSISAIGQIGWNDEFSLAAYFHRHQSLNPSLNKGGSRQSSSVRLAFIVRAVEFRAVRQRPDVVYRDSLT